MNDSLDREGETIPIVSGVLLSSSLNYRHNVHNLMILMNLIIIIFAKSQYFDDLCQ